MAVLQGKPLGKHVQTLGAKNIIIMQVLLCKKIFFLIVFVVMQDILHIPTTVFMTSTGLNFHLS